MAHTFSMVGVPAGDTTRQTFIEVVSSNYFDALGVPLAAGRAFTLEEERPVGAHSGRHRAPRARGRCSGKTVKINAIDFTVVGVAPPKFTGTMALISPEMWLPLGMFDVVVNDIFKNNGTRPRRSAEPVAGARGTAEAGPDARERARRGSTRCRGSSSARIRPRTRTSC